VPLDRKLVAVVMADVVGYSRLMERDESGTHARLRELRALIAERSAALGGRLVKTIGDGFLLAFASATAAVRFAIDVQRELAAREAGIADDVRLSLRIGVNLGDVIVEGDDIFGDGVNVAARLESIAEPGGICVAAAILEQVHEDLGVAFEDRGEQVVKNIATPIRAFRVSLDGAAKPSATGDVRLAAARRPGARVPGIAVALAALGVVAAAGVVAWRLAAPPPETTARRSALVAPFDVSTRPDAPVDASALTRQVARLLRDSLRQAWTIAEAPPGTVDPRAAARAVGARLVAETDVRVAGDDAAIAIRIADVESGRQLADERLILARAAFDDAELASRRITSALRTSLLVALLALPAPPGGPGALDLVDRADAGAGPVNDPLARETWRLGDAAIKLDPALASAWRVRADAALTAFERDFSTGAARSLADADADSLRAIAIDDRDALSWRVRANVLSHQGKTDAARVAIDRALELDPTRYSTLEQRGWIALEAGRPDEALGVAAALRRSTGYVEASQHALPCAAHLALGEYADAIGECERFLVGNDDFWFVSAYLAAAYALSDRPAEAGRFKSRLLAAYPDFTIGRYEAKFAGSPAMLARDRLHLLAGLRKAGVPE
jgi:class 3 adenylate cyclase/tetratricopeptide (TPR) repeat protein